MTKCVFGGVCFANDVTTRVTRILEHVQSTRSSKGAVVMGWVFGPILNGLHGLVLESCAKGLSLGLIAGSSGKG